MLVKFLKYQGTGNDFVIIDNRNLDYSLNVEQIKFLCDRRFGIGADGLILLQLEQGYDFRMVYYNSDGCESTMCGNGGRCIAKFASDIGINFKYHCFVAIDGPHEFMIAKNDEVKLKMKDVQDIELTDLDYIMDTGSPHYVRFIDHLEELPIVNEARLIRYNERFSDVGINVNFVENINNNFYLRTYERGVEDETLSCGTGTVAAAISIAEKVDTIKDKIEIKTKGGFLRVYFKKNAHFYTDIWLEGSALQVFKGEIEI